jgi:hypothetical protein
VLAAQAPDLLEALERGEVNGPPHMISDNKIIETDRVRVKMLSKKGRKRRRGKRLRSKGCP